MLGNFKNFLRRINGFILSPLFPAVLISVGIFLRLSYYLESRPFWQDEAWLALDITLRPFIKILTAYKYVKPMPIGFGLVCKVFITLFGTNEYAFRLFPILSGSLSVILYHIFLRRITSTKTAVIALWLFAVCAPLVYYSAELKYYSSDIFVVLILFLFLPRMKDHLQKPLHLAFYGILGYVAMWISHPALFVLAGIALTWSYRYLKDREYKLFYRLLIAEGLWFLGFVSVYILSLRHVDRFSSWKTMWTESFWPLPPWSIESLAWLKNSFLSIFQETLGFNLSALCFLLCVVGGMAVSQRRKDIFSALLLPLGLALIASGLQKYPFYGRILLFMAPVLILFLAEGITQVINKNKLGAFLGIMIILILSGGSLQQIKNFTTQQKKGTGIRSAMVYLQGHQQQGDRIYVNNSAQYAYWYYMMYYNYHYWDQLVGVFSDVYYSDEDEDYSILFNKKHQYFSKFFSKNKIRVCEPGKPIPNLRRVEGHPRVWALFSDENSQVRDLFLNCFDQIGEKKDAFRQGATSLYLYDFSQETNKEPIY